MLAAAVGQAAAWPHGSPPLRLPDLDQLAPYDVSVRREGGRTLLAFASAVANVGDGPLVVEGRRPAVGTRMTVTQVVRRKDGSSVAARIPAVLRYVHSSDHEHWHLLRFDRYELRREDGTLAVPDRKTGFCLGDRKRLDPPLPGAAPRAVFRSRCALRRPRLLSIREGISVGWLDDYKPALEGQELDVTELAPGRYVLVHRANADRALREIDYANNAASALLQLAPGTATVVRSCPDTAECS